MTAKPSPKLTTWQADLAMTQVPGMFALTVLASDAGHTVDCGCGVYCHVCGTHAGSHGTCAVWRL